MVILLVDSLHLLDLLVHHHLNLGFLLVLLLLGLDAIFLQTFNEASAEALGAELRTKHFLRDLILLLGLLRDRGLIDLLLDDFGHLLELIIDEILNGKLGLTKLMLETTYLLGD